jgi:hypothetical protein
MPPKKTYNDEDDNNNNDHNCNVEKFKGFDHLLIFSGGIICPAALQGRSKLSVAVFHNII